MDDVDVTAARAEAYEAQQAKAIAAAAQAPKRAYKCELYPATIPADAKIVRWCVECVPVK